MLRRMSRRAAGFEDHTVYAYSDLRAPTLEGAMAKGFRSRGIAMRKYAIAGAQHLDHLADLVSEAHRPVVRRHALLIGRTLDIPAATAEARLIALVERHAIEWHDFLQDQGARSFLRQWTRA